MNLFEKIKTSKILNNDLFMSSIGLAFLFAFTAELIKLHSVDLLSNKISGILIATEIMNSFNSCLYPSALALIFWNLCTKVQT